MKQHVEIKRVRAPVRIDFGGGTTDVYPFTHLYGGAVLNAAINKYVVGHIIKSSHEIGLQYHAAIPTSSGLGTSATMNLVWLALISKLDKFSREDQTILAEKVYQLENIFEGFNGRQDQYASALGGINFMEFHNDKVKVHPVKLPRKFISEFEDNLTLVYTGKPHYASSANGKTIENLKEGKNNKNLLAIKDIAIEMHKALLKKDLDRFAGLLNEETEQRKQLHRNLLPKFVKHVIKKGMKNGATAAKITGSGNGGCVLFYGNKEKLKETFGDKVLNFRFDFEGLKALED
jgi:D-glycero-alpha-D-manno-heptose-7-phosphate kinase